MTVDTGTARGVTRDRGIAGEIAASLADAFRTGSRVQRACFVVAAMLVASGLAHLGILVATGGSWTGPISWRKPMTFGLSFGLTLATLTWVLSFVSLRARTGAVLLGAFALACVVEVAAITVQRWRGQPSHFMPPGTGGPLAAIGPAVGAVVIVATVAVGAVAAWRTRDQSPSMRLALRVGWLSLAVAMALGVLMIARGMMLARGVNDVAGAFAFTAGIKPGHAATMHGVLVLPALAWLLRFTDRPEPFRLRVVQAACAGYALFAAVVVVESLTGLNPWAVTVTPVAVTVLVALGVLVLAAAGAAAIRAVATTPRRR